MPVLVTNADTSPGLDVAHAVASLGGEVRAFCGGTGDVAALRAAGVFVSVGTPDDEGRLEAALEQVHTVVHLDDPTLAPSAEVWASRAAVVLRAATSAGVHRLITRSVPGADVGDELAAVTAAWERAVTDAPPTSIIVRIACVDTDGLRDALASALGPGTRGHEIRPVGVAELVDHVVALDDARSSRRGGHAVFHLEGAPVTVQAHLATVAPDGVVGRPWVPAARVPLLPMALSRAPGRDPDAADLRDFVP